MKIDSTKLVVRPISSEDKKAIVEIDRAITGRDRTEYIEGKFHRATKDKGLRDGSLVAEYDSRVVGFVMGEIYVGEFGIPDDTATIDTIGVHPDVQRNGIANLLLSEYKNQAKAAGVHRLHTLVDWSDRGLIHFFDTQGFSPARTLSLELRMDLIGTSSGGRRIP